MSRQPKILLIGADCTGKTTLAKSLAEHYSIEHIPNRRIKDDKDAVLAVQQFAHGKMRGSEGFILDQWQYPVDIVYNRALGTSHADRQSPMEEIQDEIRTVMQEQDVIIIWLWAHSGDIRLRFEQRGDELWNLDQILEVNRRYAPTLVSLKLYYHFVDTTKETPLQVFNKTKSFIDKRLGGELKWDPKLYC
ncbi:hypothetical protein D3C76_688370 [compost metagenome]